VIVVCLGNICRSPMAEAVLAGLVRDAGLDDRVEVSSAGTGDWHLGSPMDRRAAALLAAAGYDPSDHQSRQVSGSWHDEHDLVLAMDAQNLSDLQALAGAALDEDPGRLRLFREYDPLAEPDDRDVPDPFYGDEADFEDVLAMVRRTSRGIVDRLAPLLDPGPSLGQ
jgi:protein-tyrosine phosphatase